MDHVEWQESRGGELYFVEADKTASGWTFSERSTHEVRWFWVTPKPGWIEKAERLARRATRNTARDDDLDGEPPQAIHAREVGVGTFSDNASIFVTANWRINNGEVREGLAMLEVLRDHIIGSADPKTRMILLPVVERAIDLAHAGHVEPSKSAPEPGIEAGRGDVRTTDSPGLPGGARESKRSSADNVSRFKSRLVDVVGLVTALSWTHSLLVHEVITLPGLTISPTMANVVAGSVLAILLSLVSSGGRVCGSQRYRACN
jgi:hypothetical protein